MSEDIVQRLRGFNSLRYDIMPSVRSAINAAADEIERMRAELTAIRGGDRRG